MGFVLISSRGRRAGLCLGSDACIFLCILIVLAAGAAADVSGSINRRSETVSYPEFAGFDSITYESEFFGYQSGINRDFTNYGRGFAAPLTQSLGWGNVQVALADFNGDGVDDIAGYEPGSGGVTWLEGKGDGTFATAEPHKSSIRAHGIFVAGDFNGDGYADIGVVNPDGTGKVYICCGDDKGRFGPEAAQVVAGDFNGDGLADLCAYDAAGTGDLRTFFRIKTGGFQPAVESSWPSREGGGRLAAADFNGDHYSDIAVYGGSTCPDGFAFRFGRGDGTFGPTADEQRAPDNRATHLYANFAWPIPGARPAAGQLDDDGAGDIGLYDASAGKLRSRVASGHPAYDYSVHLIKDGSRYRMWHGGRWKTVDENGSPVPFADGDHVLSAYSYEGRKWYRRIDGPEFPKGEEEGFKGWWVKNYLEPEVVKVNGTYHMFWQVEIRPGEKVDTGETATTPADRIGISTSTDGVHWKRKTDRGVVINLPRPGSTKLTHHEAIYVPDDADGKPWWLYTFHFVGGKPAGHVRIRSNDPTTFDWRSREPTSGMSQIGNQIGYADEAPGGRLFLRITFTSNADRRAVPTFQLSRDGLNWKVAQAVGLARPQLASSRNGKDNENMYFLGFSTIDGTGKMHCLGGGRFHALYGASTSNSPGQPAIWHSEIGVGEVFITFNT